MLLPLNRSVAHAAGSETARTRHLAPWWIWPAACCGAVLLAILLANPFNDSGFDDDWSYGRVAIKLAQNRNH